MNDFKRGYDDYIKAHGAHLGVQMGGDYVHSINIEIDKLVDILNNPTDERYKMCINCLCGYKAEDWIAGTFNINAAVRDSSLRAVNVNNNGLIDIWVNNGEIFQLKYCKDGEHSARQVAKTWHERYMEYVSGCKKNAPMSETEYCKGHNPKEPYYDGQYRLIPTDQLNEAKAFLELKIAKELPNRPEEAKRYQDALNMLTDRIKGSDGTESIPLTKEQATEIARIVKDHQLNNGKEFDPADWGLTPADLIAPEYLLKQALKAGLSAAIVSLAMKVGQELCGIIMELIKTGEIDSEQFKKSGFAVVESGTEGFVNGSVAAAITIACTSGALGEALKAADPTIIGAITAIAMNTVKNACLLAFGRISKTEFVSRCGQNITVTACSIGLGIAGAAVATALLTPASAIFGYMIGSFVGSVIGSFVFKGIEYCVLAFCIETGCTFFGLVEQDYQLPRDVLDSTGVLLSDYEKIESSLADYKKVSVARIPYKRFEPERISITFLRRGVIGVGRIGFVDKYGIAIRQGS